MLKNYEKIMKNVEKVKIGRCASLPTLELLSAIRHCAGTMSIKNELNALAYPSGSCVVRETLLQQVANRIGQLVGIMIQFLQPPIVLL